jgi:CRISPR-associated protein Csd1
LTIINGTEYPEWCLSTVITRIRKDRDTDDNPYLRFNSTRVGLVKACIIRHFKEDISMALDKTNTEPAYLCGRLFACLEKIQRDSSATKLNRTICDSYFSTAMSTPASVFPRLIELSNHHLSKIKKQHENWAIYDSNILMEIMENLGTEFPHTLTLYDQGKFILGYYQQKQAFFTKSNK